MMGGLSANSVRSQNIFNHVLFVDFFRIIAAQKEYCQYLIFCFGVLHVFPLYYLNSTNKKIYKKIHF